MANFDAQGWYTKAVNYTSRQYRAVRFYPGNSGRYAVCLHITDGSDSRAWLSTSPTSKVSAHFLNRNEGIYQHVSINDSAWANGIWEPGHAYTGVPEYANPNRYIISIENEGRPNQPLSPVQHTQLIALLRDLATHYPALRPYAPVITLLRHTDISPAHRPNCPGRLFDMHAIATEANGTPRRYVVRDHLSDDPHDNFAAVRVEPYRTANFAYIGPTAVHLLPGFVIATDATRDGWLHISEPAPWGWVYGGLLTPVPASTPVGLPTPAQQADAGTAPPAPLTEFSPILGPVRGTPQQAVDAILSRPHGEYTDFDIAAIVGLYWETSRAVGVDPRIPIAQMIHETGNLTSALSQRHDKDGRDLRNPAGIGVWEGKDKATPHHRPGTVWDADVKGYRPACQFATWGDAVDAHVGRLVAFAVGGQDRTEAQEALVRVALRVRDLPSDFQGTAPLLRALGRAHNPMGYDGCGWADPGTEYGAAIAKIANRITGT